jgi:hypothetical protein
MNSPVPSPTPSPKSSANHRFPFPSISGGRGNGRPKARPRSRSNQERGRRLSGLPSPHQTRQRIARPSASRPQPRRLPGPHPFSAIPVDTQSAKSPIFAPHHRVAGDERGATAGLTATHATPPHPSSPVIWRRTQAASSRVSALANRSSPRTRSRRSPARPDRRARVSPVVAARCADSSCAIILVLPERPCSLRHSTRGPVAEPHATCQRVDPFAPSHRVPFHARTDGQGRRGEPT